MNEVAKDRPTQLTFATAEWVDCELLRSRFRRACLAACSLATTAVLHAADDNKIIFPSGTAQTSAPAATSVASGANAFTLVIALLIAAVGAWFYWRNRKAPPSARGAQNLAIEETRSLGNRQYLVVASYGDEKFLLGVCTGRIEMLTPLGRRDLEENRP